SCAGVARSRRRCSRRRRARPAGAAPCRAWAEWEAASDLYVLRQVPAAVHRGVERAVHLLRRVVVRDLGELEREGVVRLGIVLAASERVRGNEHVVQLDLQILLLRAACLTGGQKRLLDVLALRAV